jgi:acetyl esterase
LPLDPQVVELLDQMAAAGEPPLNELTPAQVRERSVARGMLGRYPDRRADTEDRRIPGPGGDISIRVYRPKPGELPVVVFFHGGGWVIGSIETHDSICQQLAVQVPAVVVSVDYRLAPEHPYPAAVEDCLAATRWVSEHCSELGVDAHHLAVAGDSAGGNLAAVVCLRARDAGGPSIAFQLLVYPVVDLTLSFLSHAENGGGYLHDKADMDWYLGHYISEVDVRNPDASPWFADGLAGLPPALVITAEFDPLRDEGEAYAGRLREEGVSAKASRYDGMIHGFFRMDSILATAEAAIEEAAIALRAALRPAD